MYLIQLRTVTYCGTRFLVKYHKENYPRASKVLLNQCYVDDNKFGENTFPRTVKNKTGT